MVYDLIYCIERCACRESVRISDVLTEAAVRFATTFATRVRNGSDKRKYNEKSSPLEH